MKFTILFIVFLLVISSLSCHKYPEDETNIHVRNAYKRIYGEWTVTRYEVDGVDSTASFQNNPDYYCTFIFHKRRNQYEFRVLERKKCLILRTNSSIHWNFANKDKTLIQFGGIGNATGLTKNSGGQLYQLDWEIAQLDNKKMKLKMLLNGSEYKVDLNKN